MKIYIAGPDVFEPDAVKIGFEYKDIALAFGHEGLFPLDNSIPSDDPNPSLTIFKGNVELINQADVVVANLNSFRGPDPDAGTVWEIGYAKGLGKLVIGYISSNDSLQERVIAWETRMVGEKPIKPVAGIDLDGKTIEEFGLPMNLMLAHGVDKLVIGGFKNALVQINSNNT